MLLLSCLPRQVVLSSDDEVISWIKQGTAAQASDIALLEEAMVQVHAAMEEIGKAFYGLQQLLEQTASWLDSAPVALLQILAARSSPAHDTPVQARRLRALAALREMATQLVTETE